MSILKYCSQQSTWQGTDDPEKKAMEKVVSTEQANCTRCTRWGNWHHPVNSLLSIPPAQHTSRSRASDHRVTELADDLKNYGRGAFYSEALGVICLIDRSGAAERVHLTSADIALCLRWFTQPKAEAWQVSMDPIPGDSNELLVRFSGPIADTHLGYLLFRADIALKEYAMGYTIGGEQIVSEITLDRDRIDQLQGPQWKRYWLNAKPEIYTDKDGRIALTGNLNPMVLSEIANVTPSRLSSDSLAESMTAHFEALAAERKDFKGFLEFVEVVALSRWLSDKIAHDRIEWVIDFSQQEFEVPARVPVFKMVEVSTENRKTTIRKTTRTTVTGGVSAPEVYEARLSALADDFLSTLEASIPSSIPNAFTFQYQGDEYTATVVATVQVQ